MKFAYFSVHLYLAFLGSTSARSNSSVPLLSELESNHFLERNLAPSARDFDPNLCSAPPEPVDECDPAFKVAAIQDIDNFIRKLEDSKDDVECDDIEDEDRAWAKCRETKSEDECADELDCSTSSLCLLGCCPDDDDARTVESCDGIVQSQCDLEDRKVTVSDEIDAACNELQTGREMLNAFIAEINEKKKGNAGDGSDRDLPDPNVPTCETKDILTFQPLKSSIKTFQAAQTALESVSIQLDVSGEFASLAAIGLTEIGENALKAAAGIIRLVRESFQYLIFDIEKEITEYELQDADCVTTNRIYYEKLSISTYNLINDDVHKKLDSIESASSAADGKLDSIESALDAVDKKLDFFDVVDEKLDSIESGLDVADKKLDFLTCRSDEITTFVGNGCDGLDNDCDSQILDGVNLVDECDEDQVPPTITHAQVPPDTFFSLDEGGIWFLENIVVSDDCAPSDRLSVQVIDISSPAPGIGEVTIQVDDIRCAFNEVKRVLIEGEERIVDGTGHPTSTETFTFVIDGEAPEVTCGFNKPQDKNYNGGDDNPLFIDRYNERTDFVDVQFFYEIEESPDTPDKDVQVSVTVSSNEIERDPRDMVQVVKQRNSGGPILRAVRVNTFLAPFTCGDEDVGGFCLRENGSDARFYDITVVATDPSGNVGSATCTVVVVPEYDCYPGAGKGCGKSGKSPKSSKKENAIRPTRNELINQLNASEQRYELDVIEYVWNTSDDDSMVSPNPTPMPTTRSSKSAKKSKSEKSSKS